MIFLDTGILVGALPESHPKPAACLSELEESTRPFTDSHPLAEIFATLTGFYKVPIEAAAELTLRLRGVLQVEFLTALDYETSTREARSRGIMGGSIYDSLHATFSRRKKANRIVTRNPSHFRHVAPDLEIFTP